MNPNDWDDVEPELAPGPRVTAVELQKARWLLAARWRRRVARVCAPAKLTFTEWLVLDALRELDQELGDAVSQNQIAAHAGLLRCNISDLMPALEQKRLVSRGPSASGRAWRVFSTKEAHQILLRLYPSIHDVSR